MKNIKLITFLFLTSLLVTSCYEETYWVDENVTSEGKHFPVISTLLVDNTPESGTFAEGESAQISVFYWSIDPIKELQLMQTVDSVETMVDVKPYASNFDDLKQTDKMTFSYLVPSGTTGTEIPLRIIVVNTNGLTRDKSTTITVE